MATGIYWAQYTTRAGDVIAAFNIGGATVNSILAVNAAVGHGDGSFSLLGTLFGTGIFGREGKATKGLKAPTGVIFVAHYDTQTARCCGSRTSIPWEQGQQCTAATIDVGDDGSVVATGAHRRSDLPFYDANAHGSRVGNDEPQAAFGRRASMKAARARW